MTTTETPDIAAHIARGLTDLRELVAMQSVSAQGRMLPETADAVTALLEAEGFSVQRYPGQVAPVLVAEAGERPLYPADLQPLRRAAGRPAEPVGHAPL